MISIFYHPYVFPNLYDVKETEKIYLIEYPFRSFAYSERENRRFQALKCQGSPPKNDL